MSKRQHLSEREHPRSIIVVGRRWFQHGSGNTYHTASIYVDGKFVKHTERAYGYGDQYLQTAQDLLVSEGYLPQPKRFASGAVELLRRQCEALGIIFDHEVVRVSRRKDL